MKKLLQSIGLFFAHFFGDVEAFVKKHVTPSKQVLEGLKRIVDSKAANILVALTPTNADDRFRLFLSTFLTQAINAMDIANDITLEQDWTNKVFKFIKYVKGLSPTMRNALYARLESEITKLSAKEAGEQVPGHAIDSLLQIMYSSQKEADTMATLQVSEATNEAVATTVVKAAKPAKVKVKKATA